jgi:hypothetical protein
LPREAGLAVDQVNMALARLLRLRLLEGGVSTFTERQFRKLALARVREKSKE